MSFPVYNECKETGMQGLGYVPIHWELKRLKDVASHNDETLGEDTPEEADFLYVDISSVNTQQGIHTKEEVLFKNAPSRARRRVRDGDVMVSTVRTYLKAIARVTEPEENLIVSTGFTVVRPGEQLDPKYAGFLLLSNYFVDEVISRSTGVSYPAINASDLVRIGVTVPPLNEQRAISSFLDVETSKIDGLVSEQRRLIELLKEKRQAVISHAVTKGLNPNAPMKPSGIQWLGDVPEHWSLKPLKYLATFRSGGTPSKTVPEYWHGDIPWASSKDLKTETLADTIDHITQCALDCDEATLVPAGSVLVVVRGMILLHTFPVVQTLVPMAINQDLKALTPAECIDISYLPWLLRGSTSATFGRIDEAAHGTKVLRMEAWASIHLPVPPIDEQHEIVQAIEKQLETLSQLQTEAERAIELLKERRTALISAAVTGKIDVREFTPVSGEALAAGSSTVVPKVSGKALAAGSSERLTSKVLKS